MNKARMKPNRAIAVTIFALLSISWARCMVR